MTNEMSERYSTVNLTIAGMMLAYVIALIPWRGR